MSTQEPVDLAALRAEWVGKPLDEHGYTIRQEKMVAWAEACGETESRFIDPSDPDFQAHPTFTSHFSHHPALPPDFPTLSRRPGMDGGKSVELFRPLRAGERLTEPAAEPPSAEATPRVPVAKARAQAPETILPRSVYPHTTGALAPGVAPLCQALAALPRERRAASGTRRRGRTTRSSAS